KPAEPLVPRHGGIRGRGRWEHEEPRLAEATVLQAELGSLAERAAVGLLADERDEARAQLDCEPLEPRRRVREVGAAQVARAARRPAGGVRQADAVAQRLELLVGTQRARREARFVEQPPEVVPRVREVGAGRRRHTTRVDAAEDDFEAWAEDVGYGTRQAASGSRSSSRSSKRRRSSSPDIRGASPRGQRGITRTIRTVSSPAP